MVTQGFISLIRISAFSHDIGSIMSLAAQVSICYVECEIPMGWARYLDALNFKGCFLGICIYLPAKSNYLYIHMVSRER